MSCEPGWCSGPSYDPVTVVTRVQIPPRALSADANSQARSVATNEHRRQRNAKGDLNQRAVCRRPGFKFRLERLLPRTVPASGDCTIAALTFINDAERSAAVAPQNTKQTGDETEAQIIAALIENEYSVAIPFGDNDRYDLVADTGTELFRIQCKTGWIEDEVIRFKTASKTTSGGTVTTTDYDGDIDAFAVRCRDTDDLYWVPLEDAGTKNTYLRLMEPEIDHPNVKRAEAYRFDRRLP